MRIALAEGEPTEGGVATVDVDDVKAEADKLRGGRRRGRRRARARRPDAASSTSSIPTATASSSRSRPGDVSDPQGLGRRRPVHALDARARLRLAGQPVRRRDPADALRRQLGPRRRRRPDRDRDGQPRRRRVAARLPRRRAGLRLRRRADARADDLGRPVAAPARARAGAARRAAREGARRRATRRSRSRSRPTRRRSASTSATASSASASPKAGSSWGGSCEAAARRHQPCRAAGRRPRGGGRVLHRDLFQPTAVDRSEHDAAFLEIGDQFLAFFERGSREEEAALRPRRRRQGGGPARARGAGVEILPGHRLDFRDPSGNRVQIVQYDQIQFTKADGCWRRWSVSLGKTDAALAELRAKGFA